MGRIDPRWLRAARLAGATLVAVGAFDVVLRGHSLSRNEDGAILLAAGAALLALHVVLSRAAAVVTPPTRSLRRPWRCRSSPSASRSSPTRRPPPPRSSVRRRPPLAVRDAASAGLFVAALAFAGAYALTRQPRWVLVVALAIGFGAELQSAAPDPDLLRHFADSWTPAVILAAATAVAARHRMEGPRRGRAPQPAGRRRDHARRRGRGQGVRRSRRCRPRSLPRRSPGRQVAIAWWRTTPGIAVAVIFTGGILTLSLSNRTGYLGVAVDRRRRRSRRRGNRLEHPHRRAAASRPHCRRLPPPDVRYEPASARSFSASSRFWSAVIFLNSFSSARRLMTWFQ